MKGNKLPIILICISLFGCKANKNDNYAEINAHEYNQFPPGIYSPEENKYILFATDFSDLLNYPDIEKLSMNGRDESMDISFLEFFPRLKTLDITFCERISNLEPLKYLVGLECLMISGLYRRDDISYIENMKNLKMLDIRIFNYTINHKLVISDEINFEPIGKLSNLEDLRIFCGNRIDTKFLITLLNLKELTISTESEIDLVDIGKLPNLESLAIYHYKYVNNISSLKNPQLKRLVLMNGNRHIIGDYSKLFIEENAEQELNFDWLLKLNNLEEIVIHDMKINDVRSLLKLPNLKSLEIEDINVDILMPLLESKTLKIIYIEPEYYYDFPKDLFEERGISIDKSWDDMGE